MLRTGGWQWSIGCAPIWAYPTTTTAQCSASWSTLSYDVAYSMDMIKYGANGLAFVPNSQNFFMVRKENGVLTTTIKGKTDMPGVLAAAKIDAYGGIGKKWGAVSISSAGAVSGEAYNWRVYHNYNKDTYIATVTPFGGGTVARVIREDAGVVCVYADGPFNITLHGDNA